MINCEFENGNKASLRHITVDVMVLKDNKILLGKRGILNGKPLSEFGKWGVLGGFMDRDENLKEAAQREVMEESGWEIKNLKLFRINDNPDRPKEDRQNVSMVFIAEATKQVGKNDEEVLELQWFDLENIPKEEEFAFDFFNNISLYKKYLKEKFELPLIG
jgi:8-oxo-dGTP diphosphatase